MKRLQLFGRGKDVSPDGTRSRSSTRVKNGRGHARASTERKPDQVTTSGLLKLPTKVLEQILDLLDTQTLLSLCQVNSKFYDIISNKFLYEHVVLRDRLSLLKFAALIHCESHTTDALSSSRVGFTSQNLRFLVRSVEFVNPSYQDSLLKYSKYCGKDQSSTIGGSYKYSNGDPLSGMQTMVRERTRESSPPLASGGTATDASLDGRTWSNYNKNPSSTSEQSHSSLRSLFEHSSSSPITKMIANYESHTYIELMLDIIDFCPNLSHIILSEIHPGFKIPLWYSVLNDGSRDFFKRIIKGQQSMNRDDFMSFELSPQWLSDYEEKYHTLPRFKKLELRASKNKSPVRLRSNMLSCFGVFEELILQNIAVDAESLDTPLEYLPLYMRLGEKGFLDLHLPVTSLTLDGCEIIPGNGIMKLLCSYFHRVKNLRLLNLRSKFDLILSNCFPSLSYLTIDCNSSCFNDEKIVSDSYYHREAFREFSDDRSIAETLVDAEVTRELIVPPATTPVVIAMNGGYIKRSYDTENRKAGMICDQQEQYFESMRIPPFHYFFHYFKSLWDRIPKKNISIKIVNIPFTNVFPLPPDVYWRQLRAFNEDDSQTLCGTTRSSEQTEESEPWNQNVVQCFKDTMANQSEIIDDSDFICDEQLWNNYSNARMFRDIPNVNVWLFLKSLSEFKSVEIEMLRKWLFCTPRTRYDWELLLKPILNGKIPVTVRDNDKFVLYKYGSK